MAMQMKNVFSKFPQFGTFVAFIVIFVYNVVLGRDMECSCDQQLYFCDFYMALPFCILLLLQLWKDKTFHRVFEYTCCRKGTCCKPKKQCKFILMMLYHVIKAGYFGLLWVVAVLIDGDWFVCCKNYKSEQYPDLACKDREKNITLEEQKNIAELKGHSLSTGLWILCGLLAVAFISIFRRMKCCDKYSECCRELDYYKVILDEEENVLKEVLTTAAKEELTEGIKNKIHSKTWRECFDVAEDLTNDTNPPSAAENEETLQLAELRLEERNLQLEKLRLEVQKLRVEVQKLEPDTAEQRAAATGGTTKGEENELQTMKTEEEEYELLPKEAESVETTSHTSEASTRRKQQD